MTRNKLKILIALGLFVVGLIIGVAAQMIVGSEHSIGFTIGTIMTAVGFFYLVIRGIKGILGFLGFFGGSSNNKDFLDAIAERRKNEMRGDTPRTCGGCIEYSTAGKQCKLHNRDESIDTDGCSDWK